MWCRVCSQHGQALLALNFYDWMSTRVAEGGAGLRPTVFTYTAAMRAALAGNLIDRALKVFHHRLALQFTPVTPDDGLSMVMHLRPEGVQFSREWHQHPGIYLQILHGSLKIRYITG